MRIALLLLAMQGVIGAFDTLYYHEWKARLPARGKDVASELLLHASRDFLYAILFASLPFFAWQGFCVHILGGVIAAEVILTLWDFVTEANIRKPFGDVYPGERVTHAIMGILYGAMLAFLTPSMLEWRSQPSGLKFAPPEIAVWLRWSLLLMAAGVFLSGLRDLYAALGLPNGGWPWSPIHRNEAAR